jgi:hypothetical protein
MIVRKISVSLYCRHEQAVLIVRGCDPDLWEPVGGEAFDNETPLEAARRIIVEDYGCVSASFPFIHKVTGAPPGLLLYEEHVVKNTLRLNFAFIVDIPSKILSFKRGLTGMLWLTSVSELPTEKVPIYVQEAIPYALRAGIH